MHDSSVKVNLVTNQDCVDVNFGFTPAGSIGDVIFLDANTMAVKQVTGVYLESPWDQSRTGKSLPQS